MTDKGKKALKTGLTITAIIILCGYIAYTIFQYCDVFDTMGDESKAEADKWMRNASVDRMKNLYGRRLVSSPDLPAKTAVEESGTIYEYVKSAAVRREIKRISIRGKEWAYNARLMAQTGVSLAQYDLGVCYAMGAPVALDYEKAVSWFRKAAEQGHPGAQYLLGVCYENALGTERDVKQAEYWYGKAADQNYPDAQKALKSLGR